MGALSKSECWEWLFLFNMGLNHIKLSRILQERERVSINKKKVIIITGCDSGLGFSLAQYAADSGFTVIAAFLNLDSKGAKEIKRLYGGYIIQIQLDVTDIKSIQSALQSMEHYFNKNPDYSLHAFVNNAGVMVFGEFEWQTPRLIQHQINVNLLGTFRVTNAFCPLIRQHKAALSSWSDGLRVEMAKYGVQVTTIIPGSFVGESNIMGTQIQNVQEMHDNFTKEQHKFYSDYFKRYNIYLSYITPPKDVHKLQDKSLYECFDGALLDNPPHPVYKNEPWRYKIYHFFFKYSPVFLRDYLIEKFMQMPKYKEDNRPENNKELSCICSI
ncbi:hypothetical protein GWI33_004225 [Rhynchophorus ferrugineus]|uniref:Uncharacterized protein n=1 Tax=Rhynchophorus ferrugineus TaxID=354439 RepID=A0A834IL38_RHYFE|nr:hypothetical protein GWI33_004225 [Rhynchophorus ferrugineus]